MGNKDEFLAYYQDFKDKIFNYFWYRVNFDRPMAEDLTSEVFMKALEHFEDFDRGRSFQAWIYAIAHNHLLNHYRQGGREVAIDNAEKLGRDEAGVIEAKLELERVWLVVRTLPEYCREVLILRHIDGLSNTEIAICLGKEEGAVRVQISRALALLKERLGEDAKLKSKSYSGDSADNKNKIILDDRNWLISD